MLMNPHPILYEPPLNREPTPEEVMLAAQRSRWAGLADDLGAEFDRAGQQVIARVFKAIRDGSLTPEASLLAWQELYAVEKLRKRVGAKANEGLSEAVEL